MPELKNKKLDYLTEEEIIDFYELFFGNILIKKPGISYYTNLSRCLDKENFIRSVLDRLNDNEYNILKVLSRGIFIPYNFIADKLNIILNLPNQIVNKSINNLIDKKYVFLRDEEKLVVADIYFPENRDKVDYTFIDDEQAKKIDISIKIISDINNLINYFISKEINFSNSCSIYKKDLIALKDVFSKYSSLTEKEYNLVAYFFCKSFLAEDNEVLFENIKKFFAFSPLKKVFYFVQIVFPWLYPIINYFNGLEKNVSISIEELKKLWIKTFLLTEYDSSPFKLNFDSSLKFIEKLGLLKISKKMVIFPVLNESEDEVKDDVKLSSSFNLLINADTQRINSYFPSLFADFVKYNKIIEYEITEMSIKRGISNGISLEDVLSYFNKLDITVSKNVETVTKQWFEKYGSFYYSTGTFFFCKNAEKGKIINALIKKGMVKAYEIKKNEIYLIKEEDRKNFFDFLEKSDINYYLKTPRKLFAKKDETPINVKNLFNEPDTKDKQKL